MTTQAPSRRGWLLLAVWLGALALVRAGTVEERDIYWQARAGLENLAGQPLVRADDWSWAPLDEPFRQTSPAWNAILGFAWDRAGFVGIFIVGCLSILGYCAAAALLARALGMKPIPTLIGFLTSFSLALAMVSPRATLAAQGLFLAAILAGYHLYLRARQKRRGPSLPAVFLIGLVFAAVGNWIHTSWVLLAATTGFVWGLFWLSLRGPLAWRLGFILTTGVGLGLGILAGPHGTGIVEYSVHVRAQCADFIAEWMSVLTPGQMLRWAPVTIIAFTLSVGGLALLWRRRDRLTTDPRLPLAAGLLIVGLAFALASLDAMRFAGSAMLTLAPLSGAAVQAIGRWIRDRAGRWPTSMVAQRVGHWTLAQPWAVVLTLTLVLLTPGVLLLAKPLSAPLPEATLAPTLPRGCQLFSLGAAGSAVVLLRPDVPVYVDGRADYWGPERAIPGLDYLAGRTDAILPAGTTCVLLDTEHHLVGGGLARRLRDERSGWERAAREGSMEVWVPNHDG